MLAIPEYFGRQSCSLTFGLWIYNLVTGQLVNVYKVFFITRVMLLQIIRLKKSYFLCLYNVLSQWSEKVFYHLDDAIVISRSTMNIICKWSYCYYSVKASIERYKKASSDLSTGGQSASEANAQVLIHYSFSTFFSRETLFETN